ncbi:arfaptin-2-like [Orbicella faveolata]|uniref:arfaptin-2-like n=1 Tax=Orbicella faveolata TaxID=48498 RepID=UPI0009E55A28|nr:arfaptin-2-like [Orbicella faveolata]
MADERDDIRETDLNDDMISGAIGTNATTSIDFKEDDPQHFPGPSSSPVSWHPPEGTYQNGHPTAQAIVRPGSAQKIDHLKKWSISTYKYTRQYLSEKFGKGTRTVDTELEAQIVLLKETQVKYINVLKLAKQMTHHFHSMVQSQRGLADAFADLGMKSPELQDEFNYNAESQRSLVKNGEVLLGALNFFTSNLTTLVHKTMEDSIMTVKAYESARIEYDAYRTDLESTQTGPRTATTAVKAEEAKQQFDVQKEKFDRIRGDLAIKLRFLEENKVKVMHKQLLLFQNAISAYFAGNKQALENCIKEFHVKITSNEGKQASFLEH